MQKRSVKQKTTYKASTTLKFLYTTRSAAYKELQCLQTGERWWWARSHGLMVTCRWWVHKIIWEYDIESIDKCKMIACLKETKMKKRWIHHPSYKHSLDEQINNFLENSSFSPFFMLLLLLRSSSNQKTCFTIIHPNVQ